MAINVKNILLFLFFFFLSCTVIMPSSIPAQDEEQFIESLEFRGVDIKDVLRQLAKQYNINIVFSEKVTGEITTHLTNVNLDEALDSIITVNGFVYNKKGNVIKVTTQEEAQREGKQTKIFKLNNADSQKLKESLSKMLSAEGSIQADARSNSLLVTDSIGVINRIEQMIPPLDELTPQVLIEAKFIETRLAKTEKLGIDWSTTIKATGSSRPTTFPFRSKGKKETWNDNFFPPSPSGSTDFPSDAYSFPYAATDQFTFGTLDFTGLSATFDLLKSRTKTKIVANPRIVTLNNQQAKINVGKVLSLPTYERNETTGKLEVTGWQTLNVGVNLDVTPQVSPDGHIKLKLKPEVSSLTGYASSREGINEGPITSSRTAETEVLIRDGQSVVIGGLVKDESTTTVNKIPFLGDIPILGWLFTRKNVSDTSNPTEKTDLLIFVTARIVKDSPEPVIASDSSLITSHPHPFKLKTRGANAK